MSHESLWPDDVFTAHFRVPVTILKEQAAELSKLSGGLLRATVASVGGGGGAGNEIVHELNIIVPALNDFVYTLLRIRHGVTVYPLEIWVNPLNKTFKTPDEAGLMNLLRAFFKSNEVKDVLRSLVAQGSQ